MNISMLATQRRHLFPWDSAVTLQSFKYLLSHTCDSQSTHCSRGIVSFGVTLCTLFVLHESARPSKTSRFGQNMWIQKEKNFCIQRCLGLQSPFWILLGSQFDGYKLSEGNISSLLISYLKEDSIAHGKRGDKGIYSNNNCSLSCYIYNGCQNLLPSSLGCRW